MKSNIEEIINLAQNKYNQYIILGINEDNKDLCMIIQSINPEYRMMFFNHIYKFLDEKDYYCNIIET